MLEYKLKVHRRLSDGQREKVGELAENASGIYFAFDEAYLATRPTLSPFKLQSTTDLQRGPDLPHKKLHGVFADSLPDGWGLYLMDRLFRQDGYNPAQITQLERLAFVGGNAAGALSYSPAMPLGESDSVHDLTIFELGKQAVLEFEGAETTFIRQLMDTAGSGGARPKINATYTPDGVYSTRQDALGQRRIIKLTSDRFDLGHEEGRVEYSCMALANQCGIATARFGLLEADNGRHWLYQDRFDCVGDKGRLHMVSASGLLDASFREPSLDYVDLIKATRAMCGATEAKKLVRRALFNYLICNQDDHAKNVSFLCDDNWSLSPFYDVVYSPSPYAQHMTAFNGNGVMPDRHALHLMANHASLQPRHIKDMVEQMMEVLGSAKTLLSEMGVSQGTMEQITTSISSNWKRLRTEL